MSSKRNVLARDDFSSNRHPQSIFLLEHFRKPLSTFRDHARDTEPGTATVTEERGGSASLEACRRFPRLPPATDGSALSLPLRPNRTAAAMADRNSLARIGFFFGGIAVIFMVLALLVAHEHVDGRLTLDCSQRPIVTALPPVDLMRQCKGRVRLSPTGYAGDELATPSSEDAAREHDVFLRAGNPLR
jgi:hypothetical protein